MLDGPAETGQIDFFIGLDPIYHDEDWGIDHALRDCGLSDKYHRLSGK
jgi:hypothetical protein